MNHPSNPPNSLTPYQSVELPSKAPLLTRTGWSFFMLALIAVMIVLGTGVAWGSVRSFEGGIFHFATAVLGAGGGKDGAR